MPLYFIENHGQLDPRVAYYVQGRDTTLYFTAEGLTLVQTEQKLGEIIAKGRLEKASLGRGIPAEKARSRWVVKLDFVGANPSPKITAQDRQPGVISYFKGPKENWKAGLSTYGSIVYSDLWPGIDLVYSGTANRLKYTFLVKPGADPDQVKLAYRGVKGIRLNETGQLEVETPAGVLQDDRPYAYQEIEGRRAEISAAYSLDRELAGEPRGYGFALGSYDRSKPLVLDPAVFVYAGYIGGSGDDFGHDVAVDSSGNAYVTGWTSSTEATFPVTVGPDLTFSFYINNLSFDAFVAKVNVAGSQLVYCGYIGGFGADFGYGIAVDSSGNAYVTGKTGSSQANFPVTVGPDLTYNGGSFDAFVAKVNASGTALLYCGYIGGSGNNDLAWGIAVDGSGNAYVTGATSSTEATFPVTVGPDLTYNGGSFDAFVAKVNAAGTALIYAGYIGGSSYDESFNVAVDSSGNAYVTGSTSSTEATFPVTVGPDLTYNGGAVDAFVAKVNATGTALAYCGYIGGSAGDYDAGYGIAVNSAGNAYVTGTTSSTEATFPVTVGPDLTYNGGLEDAFVAKVKVAGNGLAYCGYIGGSSSENGLGIALDSFGNAYVMGDTNSTEATFPVTVGPDLTYNGGEADVYVAKVNAAGTALVYCGYIGGSDTDVGGRGIAVDSLGNAYVTGGTQSSQATFSVTVGPDLTYNSGGDTFLAKIGTGIQPRVSGRLKVGVQGDSVDVINLPPPPPLSPPNIVSLNVVGFSTVLRMNLRTDGTFDSRNVAPGSLTEASLPHGAFVANLYGSLSYYDNITVDNQLSDFLDVAGCLAPPGHTLARLLTIPTSPDINIDPGPKQVDLFLKRPVVLLHGINACWQGWSSWSNDLNDKGYITFTPTHEYLKNVSQETQVDQVVAQIGLDLEQFADGARYFLVCHSEGGVLARVLSRRSDLIAALALKIYTIGAPNSGTMWSPASLYGLDVGQMTERFNIQYPTFQKPVVAAGGKLFFGNDGIVIPQRSVFEIVVGDIFDPRSVTKEKFPPHEFPFSHSDLKGEGAKGPILHGLIIPDMDLIPQGFTPTDVARAAEDQSVMALPAEAAITSEQLVLAAGETKDISVPISCTDVATFSYSPMTTTATLSLVDPFGAPISGANVASYPNVQYLVDELGLRFVVWSPPSGIWHLRVTAGPQPGTVFIGASENSVWHVRVSTDKKSYAPSGQAIIKATFTGSLTGVVPGSVEAILADASGQELNSVVLYDDGIHNDDAPGDGIYGGVLATPALTGHYDLAVEVIGTCQGIAFKRRATWGLGVKSIGALFTGSFLDTAQDTSSDGIMDTIAETVGLNVPAAGEYLVSGDLFDSDGYPVSHGVVTVKPGAPGPVQAVLLFDLSKASCSEFGAAFRVRNLVVSDPVNSYSVLDSWDSAVTTLLYAGASFGCGTRPNPVPMITAVSPGQGFPGDEVTINVSGSGFLPGALIKFGTYTTGITTNLIGDGLMVASWTIPAGAVPGALDVTVTNTDTREAILPGGFTVATDQPPTVSVFYPSAGQLVSGTVVVSATASDDKGIQNVQFYVDGVLAGTDTNFPYQLSLDTTALPSGAHSIQAKAHDSAGQVTMSAAVNVCVRLADPSPSNNGPICAGQTLQLNAATVLGAAYSWMGPGGFVSTEQNPQILAAQVSASGVYSVTVMITGCPPVSGMTSALVDPSPSAGIVAPSSVGGGSIGNTASVPDAGGGATYSWTISNGTITAGQGTRTIMFSAGSVSPVRLGVTVQDSAGCSATGSANVIILANRVFASARMGNDSNNCASILTPCQTLAGATASVAAGGEVVILDSGGYGPVAITRAVTIEAPPGVLAFVHPPSGDAITVNAGPSDTVVLRGLTLNGGTASGITVNTVGALHVENCVISGFMTGLSMLAPGQLFVKDTIARGNSVAGVNMAMASGTAVASIDRSRFESNGVGLMAGNSSKASIRRSVASGNASGLVADGAGAELDIDACQVANNGTAGIAAGSTGGTARVSRSVVTDNGTGLQQSGSGTLLTRTDNTVEGNTTNTSGTIGSYLAK